MRGRIQFAMSKISFHRRRLCAPIWKSMSWGAPPFHPPSIEVDSHSIARDLMVTGFGVALLPEGLCREAVSSGHAALLLPQIALHPTRLNLTFPNRADMVPRVRALADYLCTHFR
ncbi:LysR substrate-binding domain-containing protein [Novosphingobium sp. BK258]|uniref:LysR substrate-binding domain-containing protein n=2 Tax=unclassified Novosphingobium TaxID=2644732 RepID=UPI00351CA453